MKKVATVSIEKDLATELVNSKLDDINKEIKQILNHWGETDTERFLLKAKNGTLKNAEDDAIDLKQLLLDYDDLQEVLKGF